MTKFWNVCACDRERELCCFLTFCLNLWDIKWNLLCFLHVYSAEKDMYWSWTDKELGGALFKLQYTLWGLCSIIFVLAHAFNLAHQKCDLGDKSFLVWKEKKKQYILRRKLEANYLIFKRSKESSVMEMEGRKAKEWGDEQGFCILEKREGFKSCLPHFLLGLLLWKR